MSNILLLPSLIAALTHNNIDPSDYKPAFGGKSVGLDLYNAGPTIHLQNVARSSKILIPTGLKICLDNGWGGFIMERGSVSKTPLKVRAGVIDPEYTGEIFVNCVNLLPDENFTIHQHQKLPFQLVVIPCDTLFNQVSEEEYNKLTKGSIRQTGSLGSSDRR